MQVEWVWPEDVNVDSDGLDTELAEARESIDATGLAEPLDPVGRPPLVNRAKPLELALLRRHDHLAAALVSDAVLPAELIHELEPLGAEARLVGAWFVVDARVDDAAIVPGLMRRDPRLFVENEEPSGGMPLGERQGRGQADDPAAALDRIAAEISAG